MSTDAPTIGIPAVPAPARKAVVRLVSVERWLELNYAAGCAPHIVTVRKWIRTGQVQPKPTKQGTRWFLEPSASFIGKDSSQGVLK